jgi:putative phosphoribosyl transferase
MRAAALAVRQQRPARLIIAVPVGARDSCEELADIADEVVCPFMPEPFHSVGLWYEHMTQASDEEVCEWLDKAWAERALQFKQGHATQAQGSASVEKAP